MEEKRIFVYQFEDFVEESKEEKITINYRYAPPPLPEQRVIKTVYILPDGRVFGCANGVYSYSYQVNSWLDYLVNLLIYDDEPYLSLLNPEEMNKLLNAWNLQGVKNTQDVQHDASTINHVKDIIKVVRNEFARCSETNITGVTIKVI